MLVCTASPTSSRALLSLSREVYFRPMHRTLARRREHRRPAPGAPSASLGPRVSVSSLGSVRNSVERFGWRGTEPFELFRSEFGQNSWNP